MKNVEDLIETAGELAAAGMTKGEVADELNVSRETASWLVESSGVSTERASKPTDLQDIHVDWSAVGRDGTRLWHVSAAMADLLSKHGENVDLTIGIAQAGVPLASFIARQLETDLGTYTPAKHQWEEGDVGKLGGSFSHNFADIRGRECYVVDDTITSGTTMRETIDAVRDEGGSPLAAVVLADKQGIESIDDIPVYSLVQVLRVEEQDE
ncbi:MAG: transcriptional regulator GfcR [Halodesulfurarchaeum sp.]